MSSNRIGDPGSSIAGLGFVFSSAWRLPSWDALYLPKPFSRVRLQSEVIFPEALEKGKLDVEGLRNRLLAVSGEALPPPAPTAQATAPTATSDPSVRL